MKNFPTVFFKNSIISLLQSATCSPICSSVNNISLISRSKRKVNDKESSGSMSSKPTTPVSQRRYKENESSRIPISLSPVPFRRTNSMRLRTNCLLNETTLKQHNRNLLQTRNSIVDRNQHLKLNLSHNRRGSFSMDTKPDSNGVDTGGTDEVDQSSKHCNGVLRRSSFTNRNGMVSKMKKNVVGFMPGRHKFPVLFVFRQCYVIEKSCRVKKSIK